MGTGMRCRRALPPVVWLAHRIDTNVSPGLYEDMVYSMRKMLHLKKMF